MNLDLSRAVHYHLEQFPPAELDQGRLVPGLLAATDALARYDQALQGMHNSEILLAPMRSQEAVVSSRMEGTVSTMDEILKYEAEQDDEGQKNANIRSEVIETFLYQRALRNAQRAMEEGHPFSLSLIKGIHQQLLSIGRGATQSPGQLKSEQNYLADAG